MYLSKAAKTRRANKATANTLAAAAAHVAQVNRHIENVQTRSLLFEAEGKRLAAKLEDRDYTISAQAASITLFKQEALQAAVREAELRGYITRTLEDDKVREERPMRQPVDTVVHTTHANRNDCQPALRTGPPSLSNHSIFQAPKTSRDPLGQRHWLDR